MKQNLDKLYALVACMYVKTCLIRQCKLCLQWRGPSHNPSCYIFIRFRDETKQREGNVMKNSKDSKKMFSLFRCFSFPSYFLQICIQGTSSRCLNVRVSVCLALSTNLSEVQSPIWGNESTRGNTGSGKIQVWCNSIQNHHSRHPKTVHKQQISKTIYLV